MLFRGGVKRVLRYLGYDVVRFLPDRHPMARRLQLLQNNAIRLVLDVGANAGQFASQMRTIGYAGRIVSFEPMAQAYARLVERARGDALWETCHYGLGHADGQASIHISRDSYSSSLLEMEPDFVRIEPGAECVGSEIVEVRRLDAVLDGIWEPSEACWLKVDAQGYEGHVLRGGMDSLPRMRVVQLELAIVPLYQGQPLFADMVQFMKGAGFELAAVEPAYFEPDTGRLLQVDGFFERTGA